MNYTALLSTLLCLGALMWPVTSQAFDFDYEESKYDKLDNTTYTPPKEVLQKQSGVNIDTLEAIENQQENQSFEDLKVEDVPEEQRKYLFYDYRISVKYCYTKKEALRKGLYKYETLERCDIPKPKASPSVRVSGQ